MADFGWIGQAATAVGGVYNTVKTGQNTHDAYSDQMTLAQQTYNYATATEAQRTKDIVVIVITLAVAAIIGLVVLTIVKKRNG